MGNERIVENIKAEIDEGRIEPTWKQLALVNEYLSACSLTTKVGISNGVLPSSVDEKVMESAVNQMKKDIRMAKLKEKISSCFRSQDGSEAFDQVCSYASTSHKNGQPILESLYMALIGKPFIPSFWEADG